MISSEHEPRELSVELVDSRGNLLSKTPNNFRQSLLEMGLSADGHCGFSFSADSVHLGDFLDLSVRDSHSRLISRKVFAGDAQTWRSQLSSEFRRDDNSCMKLSAEQLADLPDLLRLKVLLVRLRRAKRGTGYKIRFSGLNHDRVDEDLRDFRTLIEENFEIISSWTDTRYLLSFMETFVDYSEGSDAEGLLGISMLYLAERLHSTQILVTGDLSSRDSFDGSTQISIWGGMKTNRVDEDDAYLIWLTRLLAEFETASVASMLGLLLLNRLLESGRLFSPSSNYSEFYSAQIEDYIREINRRVALFRLELNAKSR